jgi:hypothetical protein
MPLINNDLEIGALQVSGDEGAELALALLRERENLYSPITGNTYALLSFYRAIDAAIPEPTPKQIEWIDANWKRACRDSAKRAEAMAAETGSLGQAVFGSRRSAIAHAKRDTILNPDRLTQKHQFILDTPVVRELARLAVKEAFGLKGRFRLILSGATQSR